MRKFLLYFILNYSLSIVNCFSQQYGWVNISGNIPPFPYDTTIINNGQDTIIAGLSDLHFIDDNEGWITTWHPFWNDSAAILHTTNGGNSWEVQMIQISSNAIWMLNENVGYAGGQGGGIIYRTTDGGNTWNIHGVLGSTLNDINFPPQPADTGYVCGFDGAISMITTTGVSPMSSGVVSDLDALSFPVSSAEGWVVGSNVVNHFSGGTWNPDQLHPTGSYSGVYFVDSQNGWAVGNKIIHTSDGQNWTAQTNPDAHNRPLFSVFFLNVNEGWAVGGSGWAYVDSVWVNVASSIILHTTNGGSLWTIEGAGMTINLLGAVQFTSLTNGYVVGGNKTLFKYTQLTSVAEQTTQPTEFRLEQNYPNPFNPVTTIRFSIPTSGNVTLKVFDILGREIKTLLSEYKYAGAYQVSFDCSGLASGVYFYRLQVNEFSEIKKLLTIR